MQPDLIYQPPGEPWPKIVYQDKDVLVVEKPSGLLSNPGRQTHLQDSVQHRLSQQFSQLYLIHRLDMATSGLMVFALRRKAEAALKLQFANRTIDKTYLAKISGVPAEQCGCIDVPIGPFPKLNATEAPRHQVDATGKAATTYYRTLWHDETSCLVQLKPITGRSHQLRVHLASLGHPILGDTIYATPEQQRAAPRLLLHATELAFDHPYHGQRLHFTCLPDLVDFALTQIPPLFTAEQMLAINPR